jgi:hypothetical protein
MLLKGINKKVKRGNENVGKEKIMKGKANEKHLAK